MPTTPDRKQKSFMPPDAIMAASNKLGLDNPLLTPQQAAALLGLSVGWLANARAGQKGFSGPPYVKLPGGRSAPIRYYLRDLQDWLMQSCDYLVNTAGATPAMHRTYGDFAMHAKRADRWLMSLDKATGTITEAFASLAQSANTSTWQWLTRDEILTGQVFNLKLTGEELRNIQAARKAALQIR